MVIFDLVYPPIIFLHQGAESFKNYSSTSSSSSDYFPMPERADGALVYVEGLGTNGGGIVVSIGGGSDQAMVEMNMLDIFDVSTRKWSKQFTHGTSPPVRVNPCAVVASSGSLKNIYMYGGQNVRDPLPRKQYNDIWILSLPSFTWVQVGSTSGNPPGRSGHTCHAVGGQMVVVGGYVGADVQCDTPGIYVFDMTDLSWKGSFDASKGYNVPKLVSSAIPTMNKPVYTPTQSDHGAASVTSQGDPPLGEGADPSLTGLWTTETVTTTFSNGQTSLITTTFQTTATFSATTTTTATAQPAKLSSTTLAALVGGSLAGVLLLVALGWGTYAYLKRRRDPALLRLGSSSDSGVGGHASDEAKYETREYDV